MYPRSHQKQYPYIRNKEQNEDDDYGFFYILDYEENIPAVNNKPLFNFHPAIWDNDDDADYHDEYSCTNKNIHYHHIAYINAVHKDMQTITEADAHSTFQLFPLYNIIITVIDSITSVLNAFVQSSY